MAGLQSSVYAAVSITWAAALLALILRVIARRMMKITWWWDDYFCVSAFIFACGYSSLQIIWTANWSLGQTLDPSLAPDRREDILLHGRLLMYCSEFCYAFSIASSKLTILTLYWRLFKLSSIRIPIIVMFTVSVIWIIIRTFMVLFQCVPIQATWDKSIKNAHCAINEGQFFFGTVLTHFCMDIIILALPAFEVGKLRLPLGQKLAVIGLFLIGAIVCMASVFVIVESVHYDNKTTQMPRDVALNFMWGAVEANIAIVSACFPLLRPVFRRILPRSFLSSYGRRYTISRPSHIRLATIPRTEKAPEGDDSSSTHQLADPEHGLPRTPEPGREPGGIQTIISSQLRRGSRLVGDRGIYVRNDMVVEVEGTKQAHGLKR